LIGAVATPTWRRPTALPSQNAWLYDNDVEAVPPSRIRVATLGDARVIIREAALNDLAQNRGDL